MRIRTRGTLRAAVLALVVALITALGGWTSPSAAMILPTTTTVTTAGSPALTGGPVTFSATVKILNLLNLGPITPTGTVTFTIDGTQQAPVRLGTCIILLKACTASITVPAPADPSETWTVSARYNGDLLSRASTGALSHPQEFVDPRSCNSSFTCTQTVGSTNESARVTVQVDSDGTDLDYELFVAMTATPLSCSRPNTGDGAFIDASSGAGNLTKTVDYDSYGQGAVNAGGDPWRVCWQGDAPFTTRNGGVSAAVGGGFFEGLLPACSDGAPRPCVDDAWYDSNWDGIGPRLYTRILTPPGDPRVTR